MKPNDTVNDDNEIDVINIFCSWIRLMFFLKLELFFLGSSPISHVESCFIAVIVIGKETG